MTRIPENSEALGEIEGSVSIFVEIRYKADSVSV